MEKMELTTLGSVEQRLVEQVTVQLQPYVVARYQKPMKAVENLELASRINTMISRALMDMGHTDRAGDSEVKANLTDTLMADFRRMPKFHTITFQEVELAVNNGVRGEYPTKNGQLLAINIANIHYWINCLLEDDKRKRALKEYNDKLDATLRSEKPKYFTPERWKKAVLDTFNQYREVKNKANPSLDDVDRVFWTDAAAAAIYDRLNEKHGVDIVQGGAKIKTLVPDQMIRELIQPKAEEEYNKRCKSHEGVKVSEFRKIADYASPVRRSDILKKHYLQHYFDELIAAGKELEL